MRLLQLILLLVMLIPLSSCSYLALGIAIPVFESHRAYEAFCKWLTYDHIFCLDDRKVKPVDIPETPEYYGQWEARPLYSLSDVMFVRVWVRGAEVHMRCSITGYLDKEVVVEVAESIPNCKLKVGERILITGDGCFGVDTDLTLLWTHDCYRTFLSAYLVLGKEKGEFVDLVESLPSYSTKRRRKIRLIDKKQK